MSVQEYISESKIKARVQELAEQINKDFEGEELHIVGVLNGSFIFCADLVRHLKVPVTLDFISASSYGDDMESSGHLTINLDIKDDIADKNVLIVEDIVDTGLTISSLRENLLKRDPKKLCLVSLLYKPARLTHKVDIDYLAFEIEDKFVIGYGLDYAGRYRELPYIGVYSHD
jgi:hypoxanthine phosphoribosyltransferase